jgi:hypothetical protein
MRCAQRVARTPLARLVGLREPHYGQLRQSWRIVHCKTGLHDEQITCRLHRFVLLNNLRDVVGIIDSNLALEDIERPVGVEDCDLLEHEVVKRRFT